MLLSSDWVLNNISVYICCMETYLVEEHVKRRKVDESVALDDSEAVDTIEVCFNIY